MAAFDALITAARPQAVGALMRYFRDLDRAEEAFQEACLRALRSWPDKGIPDDPAAWLIFVGRNIAFDEQRRLGRWSSLGAGVEVGTTGDPESERVEAIDKQAYRDDILRLFFVCCHPDLPLHNQIAVALRVVAGLSVAEIARAFLVSPKTMEQRITRAKRSIAHAGIAFSTPTSVERAERLDAVGMMIYLLFNEGYSASGGDSQIRAPLCLEAIRLARLLSTLFREATEIQGLLALCLLQHSRHRARIDADSNLVLLEAQDRGLWDANLIAEGSALVEKTLRRRRLGPFQIQAAIAAVHAQATRASDTDWHEIDRLYRALESVTPSPVVSLNRAVAVAKARGPEAALQMIEPLAEPLANYFHFHGVHGSLLIDLDRVEDGRRALERALALARTPAESDHIRHRLDGLHETTRHQPKKM